MTKDDFLKINAINERLDFVCELLIEILVEQIGHGRMHDGNNYYDRAHIAKLRDKLYSFKDKE